MTAPTRSLSDTTQNQQPIMHQIILWVLFLCVEAVFMQWLPSIIAGPFLTILLMYTYFALKETILTTVIIVIANDALGTIIGSSLSIPYLLIVFVLFEILTCKKIVVRSVFFAIVAIIICGQLYFIDSLPFRQFFLSVLFIIALLIQYSKYSGHQAEFFDKICTSLAIILALISVHAILTGGVKYYEINEYSEEFLRKGILGAGNGDSNFSGLMLCTGIVGALNSQSLHRIQKIIVFALMISALSITLSIAALVSLLIVLVLHLTIGRKLPRAVITVLIVLLLLVLAYNLYASLPFEMRNETVDAYISRVTEKVENIIDVDFDAATSNRSSIMRKYEYYIFKQQHVSKLLLGGNSIFVTGGVPHNTYVDWILQFGIIGLLLICILIGKQFINAYKLSVDVPYRKMLIITKILYLFYSLSLSIYDGPLFATLFLFVFCL